MLNFHAVKPMADEKGGYTQSVEVMLNQSYDDIY